MIRLYSPQNLVVGDILVLSPEDGHYLYTVMRKKHGESIIVFHPQDGEFSATIEVHGKAKKNIVAHITKFLKKPEVLVPRHMGLALLKSDKFLLCLEKATELCITEIHPLITQHQSISFAHTPQKWHQRIKEAAEQCERCTLPFIHPPKTLKHFIDSITVPWVVAIERCPFLPSASPEHFQKAVGVMVGPEGGFSAEERDYLLSATPLLQGVHLGPTILRAETAALFLLSCLHSTHLSTKEQL